MENSTNTLWVISLQYKHHLLQQSGEEEFLTNVDYKILMHLFLYSVFCCLPAKYEINFNIFYIFINMLKITFNTRHFLWYNGKITIINKIIFMNEIQFYLKNLASNYVCLIYSIYSCFHNSEYALICQSLQIDARIDDLTSHCTTHNFLIIFFQLM